MPSKSIPQSSLEWLPKAIWGSLKWTELHCRALACLPLDASEIEWFNSFVQSIPCAVCQHHFQSFVKDRPPFVDWKDRTDYFRWTVDAHNEVSKRLNKRTYSIKEALAIYSGMWEK